jgi:hypothetical protein
MNHAHNLPSFSFVHPAASRINMTSKPSTADNRILPSPLKPVSRIHVTNQHTEQAGRSPMKRQISFSTISPLKELTPQQQQIGQHRIYSSKLETTTNGSTSCQFMPQS